MPEIERSTGFSWNDYVRTWKSDAVWVDLRPVRSRVLAVQRRRTLRRGGLPVLGVRT